MTDKEQIEERFEEFLPDSVLIKKNSVYGLSYYIEKQALYNAGYRKVENIEDNFISKKDFIGILRWLKCHYNYAGLIVIEAYVSARYGVEIEK